MSAALSGAPGGGVWRALALIVVAALTSGCAGTLPRRPAPPPVRSDAPAAYVVQKGDTLFSIAFRLGTDYRFLARHNHIAAPYVIHPGQRLYAPDSGASISAGPGAPARKNPSAGGPSPAKDAAAAPEFSWPATGRVLRGFGASSAAGANKGIDIGGATGDPVFAAAAGEVVYAGDGLRGYGELLILKHGDAYLTAYGRNDRLLVKEGDRVKARQKIAEIGSNGSDESSLHFEIRKEGRPVDPARFLPRR